MQYNRISSEKDLCAPVITLQWLAGWKYGFEHSGSFFSVFFLMLCKTQLLKQWFLVHFTVPDEMQFIYFPI